MRSFSTASTSQTPVARRRTNGVPTVCAARSRVPVSATTESASSGKDTQSSASNTSGSRGGGTPGSWNLGVAHSDAASTDQRSYVDRLFKAYPLLVDAAKDGNVGKLTAVMDDAYVPAPDKSTKTIRDAQVRAAALEAIQNGKRETLEALLDRGCDLGFESVSDENEKDGASSSSDGGAGGKVAREAAAKGHAVCLDILINRCGVSIYSVDPKTGRTLLHCASMNGRVDCVARIVGGFFGEDEEERKKFSSESISHYVNAVDLSGNTAAMLASEFGHAGCLNQLRGIHECDMEIQRESDGMTAMAIHREQTYRSIEEKFGKNKLPSDLNR